MSLNNPMDLQLISLGLMIITSQLISCKSTNKLQRFGYLTATIAQAISVSVFIVTGHLFMSVVAFISLLGYFRGIYNYWIDTTKS